jgi:hypothetical protein
LGLITDHCNFYPYPDKQCKANHQRSKPCPVVFFRRSEKMISGNIPNTRKRIMPGIRKLLNGEPSSRLSGNRIELPDGSNTSAAPPNNPLKAWKASNMSKMKIVLGFGFVSVILGSSLLFIVGLMLKS